MSTRFWVWKKALPLSFLTYCLSTLVKFLKFTFFSKGQVQCGIHTAISILSLPLACNFSAEEQDNSDRFYYCGMIICGGDIPKLQDKRMVFLLDLKLVYTSLQLKYKSLTGTF